MHIVHMHLAGLASAWLPSRLAMNEILWPTGFILQCALAVVVFRRGIARWFPCFAALVWFYPLRAALLLALAGRIDSDVYNPLFSALAFCEVLLEALVAIEVTPRIAEPMGGGTRAAIRRCGLRGVLVLVIVLCAAGVLTWLVLRFTPARAPADRVQVFAWFVMIAVFAAALKNKASGNLLRIAAGFAAFSLIQLATSLGRSHAFLKHDAGWFIAWSYTPSIAYLAVVLFWLLSLRKENRSVPIALAA